MTLDQIAAVQAAPHAFSGKDINATIDAALAMPAVTQGFSEISTSATPVTDPTDDTRVLDTFYEVVLVHDVASVEDAVPVLKFVLSLEKAVGAKT